MSRVPPPSGFDLGSVQQVLTCWYCRNSVEICGNKHHPYRSYHPGSDWHPGGVRSKGYLLRQHHFLIPYHPSGQIKTFHQPRFPWNKRISQTKPPFWVGSFEVAIPCMACLPTFGWFWWQLWAYIPYMEHMKHPNLHPISPTHPKLFWYQIDQILEGLNISRCSGWWFQPNWKILVKLDHFLKQGWK